MSTTTSLRIYRQRPASTRAQLMLLVAMLAATVTGASSGGNSSGETPSAGPKGACGAACGAVGLGALAKASCKGSALGAGVKAGCGSGATKVGLGTGAKVGLGAGTKVALGGSTALAAESATSTSVERSIVLAADEVALSRLGTFSEYPQLRTLSSVAERQTFLLANPEAAVNIGRSVLRSSSELYMSTLESATTSSVDGIALRAQIQQGITHLGSAKDVAQVKTMLPELKALPGTTWSLSADGAYLEFRATNARLSYVGRADVASILAVGAGAVATSVILDDVVVPSAWMHTAANSSVDNNQDACNFDLFDGGL